MLAVSIMTTPVVTLPAYMSNPPARSSEVTPPSTVNRRPKLSLETGALSTTFGGLSRGATGNPGLHSTTTPTTSNTFVNQWDLSFRPSPISRTESPRLATPAQTQTSDHPYQLSLPFGVKPILKNTPLLTGTRRGSINASPREERRKILFPQPKKVTFKRNLEDVIETSKYVLRHSDLSSSEDESSENDASKESSDDEITKQADVSYTSPPPAKRRRNRTEDELQVSDLSTSVDTARPRSDRKRRKWEWTIPSTVLQTSKSTRVSETETTISEQDAKSGNVHNCNTTLAVDDAITPISNADDEQSDSEKSTPRSSTGSSVSEPAEITVKDKIQDPSQDEISRTSKRGKNGNSELAVTTPTVL